MKTPYPRGKAPSSPLGGNTCLPVSDHMVRNPVLQNHVAWLEIPWLENPWLENPWLEITWFESRRQRRVMDHFGRGRNRKGVQSNRRNTRTTAVSGAVHLASATAGEDHEHDNIMQTRGGDSLCPVPCPIPPRPRQRAKNPLSGIPCREFLARKSSGRNRRP